MKKRYRTLCINIVLVVPLCLAQGVVAAAKDKCFDYANRYHDAKRNNDKKLMKNAFEYHGKYCSKWCGNDIEKPVCASQDYWEKEYDINFMTSPKGPDKKTDKKILFCPDNQYKEFDARGCRANYSVSACVNTTHAGYESTVTLCKNLRK